MDNLFWRNQNGTKFVQGGFVFVAVCLGLLQTAVNRHYINPDGVSYLDMSDAYWRGDWEMALNSYWSPLYAILAGIPLNLFQVPAYWEATVVHLVNFVIFIIALLAFHRFWRLLAKWHYQELSVDDANGLPEWAWWGIGYGLFIWGAIYMVTLQQVTPDLLVFVSILLAMGSILKIQLGEANTLAFVSLGLILGLGFLSKAAMLPISLVFIFVAFFSVGLNRSAIKNISLLGITFILIGALFVVPLSQTKGEFTWGDSGTLNYIWFVNGVTRHIHWQESGPSPNGEPVHTTRQILERPAIFEYKAPISGTFPPWYNPPYWFEGSHSTFSIYQQLAIITSNLILYFKWFIQQHLGLITAILVLFLISGKRWEIVSSLSKSWFLFLPVIAALAMYALVYVEERYIGAQLLLLWGGILSAIRLPKDNQVMKTVSAVSVITVAVLILNTAALTSDILLNAQYSLLNWQNESEHQAWQVADELQTQFNIDDEDSLAFIGYTFDAYWARLAGVRIIADMPLRIDLPNLNDDIEYFWTASDEVRLQAFDTFQSTGASLVVTDMIPAGANLEEWQQLGNTNYYVYILE